MLQLYDNAASGNAYKVRMLLALLERPYERIALSVTDRSNRAELLGGKNPSLRIPVLRLPDGRHLGESNAILFYLAQGTSYWPDDVYERALVLQWMFFEQYDHEPNVAVARYLRRYTVDPERHAAVITEKQERGRKALGAMERHLASRNWLVGERITIADLSLYAYTHVAGEAGIDLAEFPAVGAWLARVQAQPRHVRIDA